MAGFDLVHLDDFERPFPKWALARKSLNLTSFGMNVVELPPGETIPEHDETERDQEEVFVTLSGSATIVIDGQDHPAPAGTFVRLDPEPKRTVRNDGDDVATVLIVSAPRSSGYEPMSWA
ncbi:MAG: cupin domain-containing protein [Actinobacteria bacterium]|nr:cupin domain-containing protein [Actinomycetota bacterium]